MPVVDNYDFRFYRAYGVIYFVHKGIHMPIGPSSKSESLGMIVAVRKLSAHFVSVKVLARLPERSGFQIWLSRTVKEKSVDIVSL